MEQLVITIEGKTNADLFIQLIKKFNFVKSVIRKKSTGQLIDKPNIVNEPAGAYNWTNPARPATDEEFEQLAIEMVQDKGEYSSQEVINFVNKELRAWRKMKK
ncbi:MAG: hypothetical protein COS14_13935 [Bacteroidetes bacterium CG02_land_8_20_14_3_00_31_25]|nr:hypothetical protein [Bacteroidota bacterium]PIV57605.1 MAG: hypothetical protein COS14_13935 [Bacteroidetes bacterium CG02_land_8_20_14_3_00_31_25]PIX36342.1 MAG: hypothetical protein COZ59_01625 [Bacteroidetes bacterium CG_4_8_14_3_um_filter_31_14]PIY06044.1 MAG: hypothetical protein COZ21_03410 [Bacteroidetes bacterium CG_4_10_14_3_um_filter_31_20]